MYHSGGEGMVSCNKVNFDRKNKINTIPAFILLQYHNISMTTVAWSCIVFYALYCILCFVFFALYYMYCILCIFLTKIIINVNNKNSPEEFLNKTGKNSYES
jgi:hypothetical protein